MVNDLVIIDMQTDFINPSIHKKLIGNISYLIRRAIRNEQNIFFVEFSGSGHTVRRLQEEAEQYENKHFVVKTGEDGSNELCKTFKRLNIEPAKLDICGVHWNHCVFNTVTGLLKKNFFLNCYRWASNPEYHSTLDHRWFEIQASFGHQIKITKEKPCPQLESSHTSLMNDL